MIKMKIMKMIKVIINIRGDTMINYLISHIDKETGLNENQEKYLTIFGIYVLKIPEFYIFLENVYKK